jgi:hypothetical protein
MLTNHALPKLNLINIMNKITYVFSILLLVALITNCTPIEPENSTDVLTDIDFEAEGFVSLFNGEDLSGWEIPEGDGGHWKVLDGVIDYDALSQAEGNKNLWTTKNDFRDYELYIEWKFTDTEIYEHMPFVLPNGDYARDRDGEIFRWPRENADSGILMRGGPQVQVWNWDVGSGELWSTRTNEDIAPEERAKATPLRRADNLPGEWNAFHITLTGDRVTVYLNDILVIEDGWMPNIADEGPIGLQHHGGMRDDGTMDPTSSTIQFRNIWVKEI